MTLNQRISAFTKLGISLLNLEEEVLAQWIGEAGRSNSWFTGTHIKYAVKAIAEQLTEDKLQGLVEPYAIKDEKLMKVGVVMAGNIPLAGFHDMMTVLLSGNLLYAKPSAQDPVLIKKISDLLIEIEPEFKNYIFLVNKLNDMDAVIATGSDNTARYFEYYFSKIPHIIRKNRTSIAILSGNETSEELSRLGEDIFLHFGLGCRNVSKIYVPENYDFDLFFKSIEHFSTAAQHHKYFNNYEYNKAVYLVNKEPHFDNGFLMLKEDEALVSPVSVLFYERYENMSFLEQKTKALEEKIQVILSSNAWFPGSLSFGTAQCPGLSDYADRVDTLEFLTAL
jgi:hypothetical protein